MRKFLWGWFIVLTIVSGVSLTQAQAASRQLLSGQPVSGVIDSAHLIQMYSFVDPGHFPGGLALSSMTGTLPLALLLVNSSGKTVIQTDPTPPNTGSGMGWGILDAGTYYVIVMSPQVAADQHSTFTLTLNQSTLPLSAEGFGLQFELDWQVGARLSFEVRDPNGQSLHWHSTETPDTGSFVGDTDPIDCATFAPHTQKQYARWQAPVPGSYELLVHYIDGCTPTVPFTLSANLTNQAHRPISGAAQQGDTFITSFFVGADFTGEWNGYSHSGLVGDNDQLTLPTADLIANAEPLFPNGSAQGHISGIEPYHSYHFEGQADELISASVRRISGSLDTVLALIDSDGNLLAFNDDSADGTTNSAISNIRLPRDGTYVIVVSHYGQMLGATEGDFVLSVM